MFSDYPENSYAEQRLRAILEQSPFSIQIFARDGRTLRVNKAWERLWGIRFEEIRDYNILEDKQLIEKGVMPYIRRAFEGEAAEIPPIPYVSPQCGTRWTKAVIYPIKDESGEVREVILIHEDITERILAEEKLKASEERYRMLFDATLDCIMMLDDEGRYVDVNESFCRKLKASRGELIGTHFSEYIIPERIEESRALFDSLKESRTFTGHFPMRARDGSVIEFEWNWRGNFIPGLHVCFARDVTESKKAEQALRESEERFRSLLENANDIIYSHDLEGNYLSINRAGEKITGYTREEILGGKMNMAQVVAPEYLESTREMIARKLKEPDSTVYEVEIIARDGRRLTLEVSTRISFNEAGEPVAVEGVARDVTERKRVEQEKAQLAEQIAAQKKRLQALVSSVPGVVWEAWGEPDDASQRIGFVSEYVEKMLGYSIEEWLSTPSFWLSIVHPDDRERAAATARRTFENGSGINQFRWITKDGRVLWVEAHSATIYDEQGNPVGMRGVTMDITSRKEKEFAEKFLAEASAALGSSLEYESTLATVAHLAVPHFADWCGVDVAGSDGRLERLAAAHSNSEKIRLAQEIYDLYPPDPKDENGIYNVYRTGVSELYPEMTDELLRRFARDERHLEIIRQIGLRSVMIVPLKARGKVLGVITFVSAESGKRFTARDLALAEDLATRAALAIDNAQLFRAEQEVRRAAERRSDFLRRLQSVSSSLSQAMIPHDVALAVIEQGLISLGAHAGAVVHLDVVANELEIIGTIGFSDEVFNKWKRFDLNANVPIAESVRRKTPILIESLEVHKDVYPDLGPLASVSGSRSMAAFPLIFEGRITGAIGLSFPRPQSFSEDDISFMIALAHQCSQALERARLYETEQRLRAQAEAANRIKDEFLATVSHELRTPLNAIVGWSNLLVNNALDAKSAQNAIETINRNAKAQQQIIEDLLDVSRIITGKLVLELQETELEQVIRTALESVRPAAETKHIKIKSSFGQVDDIVLGDPDRLQQIMWNLLSNAIKFTPDEGEIEVRLENPDAAHVEIRVSDTGQGISPEFLPFVFNRFSQADGTLTRRFGGLGLGLAIVRHLVEMHGGSVRAESPGVNQGATFIVNLLLRPSRIEDNSASENRLSSPAPESENNLVFNGLENVRLLLVDDDEDSLFLLTTIVENSGASVVTADSVKGALEVLKKFKPHVLISDIGMPDEDGYALIRKVRALYPEEKIPAIALTAYAREEDRLQALEAGFHKHLTKPFRPEELLAAIKELVEQDGSEEKQNAGD